MTRTLNSAAWDGRVVFQTRHVSFGVLEEADGLKRRIDEQCPELSVRLNLQNLTVMLACTVDIEFNFQGDENPPLLDLMDFWQEYHKAKAPGKRIELAVEWYKFTSNDVIANWLDAINHASAPVRRPEQLPESMLTEEERAQLEDPNSPLVSPEENLEKASSTS